MPKYILIILCITLMVSCQRDKTPLHAIINSDPELKKIADADSPHEVQIIYTRIGSDEIGYPVFDSYKYNVDSKKYFYPASTVKMPVAFLALEKLNDLNVNGLNRKTSMFVDSVQAPQTNAWVDSTTSNFKPTIERYIEKIFAVSDNDAYNRLYEFLGQEYINDRLGAIGAFSNSKIVHRLENSSFNNDDNKHTPKIRFVDGDKEIFKQEAMSCDKIFETDKIDLVRGVAYKNNEGKLINQPFDFTHKNAISLEDLEGILKRIIYPESFEKNERFNLNREQLNFLLKAMSSLPKDSGIEIYKDSSYFDSYVKFFMFGDNKDPIPDYFKIYNKVGQAYGFLIDCAFIQDQKNDVEFFLTACINVNKNKTYNDNQYEYDEIGFPFLAKLGRRVYEYELSLKEPKSNSK